MLVTFEGMVIDVRLLQLEKAELPMMVTLLGMIMEVRLLQFSKAEPPMPTTSIDRPLYINFEITFAVPVKKTGS